MNIYCTLFDSNYLDKGLVLYHSLCACEPDFRLYVFAFDERCREVLEAEALEHMVVVPLSEFETPELQKVKEERTRAEYCWTCTPWTVRHVLERYREPMCTYIDADMMFYSSPQFVFDAMRAQDCSVIIVPHRLNRKKAHDRRAEQHVGTYCVEFNTFVNDARGRTVLDWWAEQCLNWCFYTPDVDAPAYGDQKYLNEFPKRFPGVFVCEDWGGRHGVVERGPSEAGGGGAPARIQHRDSPDLSRGFLPFCRNLVFDGDPGQRQFRHFRSRAAQSSLRCLYGEALRNAVVPS